jgi:hypothetical protein
MVTFENTELEKELVELRRNYMYIERDYHRQEQGLDAKLKELD